MFTPEAVGLAPETPVGVSLVSLEAVVHAAISAVSKAVSRSTSMGLHARKVTGVTEQVVRFTYCLIIFSFYSAFAPEVSPPFVLSDASMTRKRHESVMSIVMGSGSKL
jgi:hypothetical protein